MPGAGETTTGHYGWIKPAVGGSATTWGGTLNDDLDAIDAKLFQLAGALNANNLNLSNNPGTGIVGSLTFINSTVPLGQQTRWALTEDFSAEVGGGAGSNLSLTAYSSVGTLLSTPLAINRASGAVTFGTAANFSGLATFNGGFVTGAATFNGTLAVTGAATFGGTLRVTGAATFAAATFSGALTPSAGIVGSSAGDNAASGSVGEVIAAVVTAPVGMPQAAAVNVATLALPPGDWDIQGELWLSQGAGGVTEGFIGAVSPTSATIPAAPAMNASRATFNTGASAFMGVNIIGLSPCRASVAGGTTYYLVAFASFSGASMSATGKIWARRAR